MIFYHGTSKDNWDKIQEEGILFGRRFIVDDKGNPIKECDRCTYLAVYPEEANNYGDVLLEVEYDLNKRDSNHNNFDDTCWQLRVYEPISIDKVKRVKIQDIKPLYIRFGKIPQDGFSRIHSYGEEVGKEVGVSCYRCLIDENDVIHICLPLPFTESRWNVLQGFIHYDDRPAFLITGDFIGYGSEGEPLLKNVMIAKPLGKNYRKKEE